MKKYILKQLLINSIKKLPIDVLNLIKDFIFNSNIIQFIKVHKIKQMISIEKDTCLYWIIQRPLLTYRLNDDERVNYYPIINNCYDCGEYLVGVNGFIDSYIKKFIDPNYIIDKVRCKCNHLYRDKIRLDIV